MRKDTPAQLRVRLKEPLRAKLEQSAQERRQSLNAEIVGRLEKSFSVWGQLDAAALRGEIRKALQKTMACQREIMKAKKEGALPQPIADMDGDLGECAYTLVEVLQLLEPRPRQNNAVLVDMPGPEESK
jgi:hypothetical protein